MKHGKSSVRMRTKTQQSVVANRGELIRRPVTHITFKMPPLWYRDTSPASAVSNAGGRETCRCAPAILTEHRSCHPPARPLLRWPQHNPES